MENNQFIVDSIQKSFDKQFPNAWSIIRVQKLIGEVITVTFGLVDKSELTSGILENDPVFHSFIIHIEGDDKYEAAVNSSGISINPPEGSYYAMERVKTKFRKTKGDSKRIVKTFDTFFKRLKVLVKANEANIYQRQNYSDKYFK